MRGMDEYKRLMRKAIEKNWKRPVNSSMPIASWINYWRQCEEYERNPDTGRPVVALRRWNYLLPLNRNRREGWKV